MRIMRSYVKSIVAETVNRGQSLYRSHRNGPDGHQVHVRMHVRMYLYV